MKKTYIIPSTCVTQAEPDQMMAISGVISNSNNINIGYGGVDTDGEIDPNAKESAWSIWED